jgi:CBS domain containing-hemolysin-like protein
MEILILVIVFVIISSGLFSGLEAALFAVSENRLRVLEKQENVRGIEALIQIKAKINRPIIVIVIGNNIANIVGSIFVGALAASMFESTGIGNYSKDTWRAF